MDRPPADEPRNPMVKITHREPAAPAPATPKVPLVLSIDDDPRIHKIIELHLKKKGYDVILASSGPEALEMLKQQKPDVILLDVMMPGMDGYEVCSTLHNQKATSQIPVVFVTGLGEEKDKVRAFNVGAVDYLVKPFQKEDLLGKVGKHLDTGSRWKAIWASKRAATDVEASGHAALRRDFKEFRDFLIPQLARDAQAKAQSMGLTPQNMYARGPEIGLRPRDLAQHIADFLRLPYVRQINPQDVMLGVFPTAFCRSSSIVALSSAAAGTVFVMSNPFDLNLRDALRRHEEGGQTFNLAITEPENVDWVFKQHESGAQGPRGPREDAKLIVLQGQKTSEEEEGGVKDLTSSAQQAPVIALVNSLIVQAIQKGASDIHIEPRENSVGVRFRIDGVLHEQDAVPKHLARAVISRLKIMTNMDIAQQRIPQDGSTRVAFHGRNIDLRFSVVPARHGEKAVIRILDHTSVSLDFEALGLEGTTLQQVRDSISKPNGILLVTGPTGSGKSTTLYTALQSLNEPGTNVVTVEDPVEYELHRITQIQVHPEAGLTFPIALRSILRQDPDVIMVGEIRDAETLDIAIKAALTGHLVLSTLHTNDAPSTVIRLRDMAEPYLVAASLQMVAAQRLVRKLCAECKKPAEIPPETFRRLEFTPSESAQFYVSRGCDACSGTGFRGRFAIIEVMVVDDAMRELISREADILTLRRHAVEKCGMTSLRHDGLLKASRGLSSIEEVLTVTG